MFVMITALLIYGQGIGSILDTQTQTVRTGASEEALRKKYNFIEDIHVNNSNTHVLPNITVVTKEYPNKSKYPVVNRFGSKACGCPCMLDLGSYEMKENID